MTMLLQCKQMSIVKNWFSKTIILIMYLLIGRKWTLSSQSRNTRRFWYSRGSEFYCRWRYSRTDSWGRNYSRTLNKRLSRTFKYICNQFRWNTVVIFRIMWQFWSSYRIRRRKESVPSRFPVGPTFDKGSRASDRSRSTSGGHSPRPTHCPG